MAKTAPLLLSPLFFTKGAVILKKHLFLSLRQFAAFCQIHVSVIFLQKKI